MKGFILETLAGRSWRRDGKTYWTREAAEAEAARLIRRGKASHVRVLPVTVSEGAVSSLPLESMEGRQDD